MSDSEGPPGRILRAIANISSSGISSSGPPSPAPGVDQTVADAPPATRSIRLGGRDIRVILPSVNDPRLHLAAVIISLQILGQTTLRFDLSIAQILVAVLTSAVLEVVITARRTYVLAWPASALLTGNGVAFILRVPGTDHGDWWSMRGWWIFAAASAASLLSKYVLRQRGPGGRHFFNPSNLGLVVVFMAYGPERADPQDLWWGNLSVGLGVTLALIVVGGLVIVSRLRMLALAIAFWTTFAAAVGVIAMRGHCMTARWHIGPVCGRSFWWVLATSPEILVFTFFMITDPKTTPRGRVARIVFGVSVALVAAALVAPARSEFSTKLAVLVALVIACALTPLLEHDLPVAGSAGDRLRAWWSSLGLRAPLRVGVALVAVVVTVGLLVVAGARTRAPVTAFSVADPESDDVAERRLELPAVPPVAISADVQEVFPEIDQAAGERMAKDVIADLLLAADALERRDAALATEAGAPPWTDDLDRQIETATKTDRTVVTTYRFEAVNIVFGNREDTQASPEPSVQIEGRVRTVTHAGPRSGAVVTDDTEQFDRLFFVFRVDGRGPYLINLEREPTG